MIKKTSLIVFAVTFLCLGIIGCSQGPTLKGVELGNPDPVPTTVRITPEGGMTTYDITLLAENQASILRTDIRSGTQQALAVPAQNQKTSILIFASFPGLEEIEVRLFAGPDGKIRSASLKVNGQPVTITVETIQDFPAVSGDPGGTEPKTIKFDSDGESSAVSLPPGNRPAAANSGEPAPGSVAPPQESKEAGVDEAAPDLIHE